MTSIQRQLIRTLIIVVPSLAALSGIVIYVYCRARLTSQFDRGLTTEMRSIADSVMREGNGDLEIYFAEADHPARLFRTVARGWKRVSQIRVAWTKRVAAHRIRADRSDRRRPRRHASRSRLSFCSTP
jgi:hypothetical protein